MNLTRRVLLKAKPQDKRYKIGDRDSRQLRASGSVQKYGDLTTGWMARTAVVPFGDCLICR